MRGFDEVFYAPHSRHTGIRRADVDACDALRILAESDVAGPVPHEHPRTDAKSLSPAPEYDKYTLDAEYKRDVAKACPSMCPSTTIRTMTRSSLRCSAGAPCSLLYENWLNYYVYQNTPYDLGEIQRVKHGK